VMAEIEAGTGGGGTPSITKMTDPDPPYTDPPARYDNLIAAQWDPSGTYLAVGGYNDDFDEFFAWYKLDGGVVTKLTDPTSAPQGAAGLAWDDTGTYLAISANTWWGNAAAIYLYKRSGDTLTLVDTVAPGGTFYPGHCIWDDTYLIVGSFYSYTMPWNSGADGIGIYQRSGDSLAFVDSVTIEGDFYSFDWSPDRDYLLTSLTEFTPFYVDKALVYSWDGAGTLALVEEAAGYTGNWQEDAKWNPAGTHFAYAKYDNVDGWGASLWSWDAATETATELAQVSSGKSGYVGQRLAWSPTGDFLFVVGAESGAGDNPQVRVLQRNGSAWTWIVDSAADAVTSVRDAAALHPDCTHLAVGHEDGNILTIWELEGFSAGSDLVIRLSAGAWADEDEWEAAYDADTHAWIRFRHDSGTGTIYLETADVNCGCWTERLAYLVPASPAADLSKLALEAEAWVTTAETDTAAPSIGFYGPMNPIGDELSLTLTNSVQTLYLEGTSGLTLTLTNEVGDY
jgi:hypothetical protein